MLVRAIDGRVLEGMQFGVLVQVVLGGLVTGASASRLTAGC